MKKVDFYIFCERIADELERVWWSKYHQMEKEYKANAEYSGHYNADCAVDLNCERDAACDADYEVIAWLNNSGLSKGIQKKAMIIAFGEEWIKNGTNVNWCGICW